MTTVAVRQRPRLAESAVAAKDEQPSGLTDEEAHSRLAKSRAERDARYIATSVAHGAREILGAGSVDVSKLRIVLEVALGKYVEAAIVAGLLVH